MMDIFVYGSLMFDRVRNGLIKSRYCKCEGRLAGYKRLRVRGEVYPGLVASKGDSVDGLVLFDVDPLDIRTLDHFEGDYFSRARVDVMTANECVVETETYVFREDFRHLLSSSEWDVDAFGEQGILLFLDQYRGFLRRYE